MYGCKYNILTVCRTVTRKENPERNTTTNQQTYTQRITISLYIFACIYVDV